MENNNQNPTQIPAQPVTVPAPQAAIPVHTPPVTTDASTPMGAPQGRGKGPMVILSVFVAACLLLVAGMYAISMQKSAPKPQPAKTVQRIPTMTPTPTLSTSTNPEDLSKEANSISIGNTDEDFKTVDQDLNSK